MSDLVSKLIAAGKAIIPLVPGGAEAVEAAEAIVEALEAAKDLVTPGDQSQYDGTIANLQAAVNARVDKTVDGLRGED